MDKFTENLAEGIRRFAMAGVGAVSMTIEKSKEIIDQLVAKGEVTTSEGQAACEDLQKKMATQLDGFMKNLKANYEKANFESLLEQCDRLSDEQRAIVMDRLNHPQVEEEPQVTVNADEEEKDAACCEDKSEPCCCDGEKAPCDKADCDETAPCGDKPDDSTPTDNE